MMQRKTKVDKEKKEDTLTEEELQEQIQSLYNPAEMGYQILLKWTEMNQILKLMTKQMIEKNKILREAEIEEEESEEDFEAEDEEK